MTSDEPTIGQIHNLTEDDPWDRRSLEQRQADEAERKIRAQPKEEPPITALPPEADEPEPEDDENIAIRDELGVFHRMTVPGYKLTQVIQIEPSLPKLCITMRNNARGCWFAFTSLRVSRRIANTLGIENELEVIDQNGMPIKL